MATQSVEPISDFILPYPKRTAVKAYLACLRRFIESVNNRDCESLTNNDYESMAADYLNEVREKKRNPRNDLIRFSVALGTQSPITQRTYPSRYAVA